MHQGTLAQWDAEVKHGNASTFLTLKWRELPKRWSSTSSSCLHAAKPGRYGEQTHGPPRWTIRR